MGQTLGRFKAAKAPKKVDVTIAEFPVELRSLHASRAKTIEYYAGSLRMIAAWIAGLPAGGRGGNPENQELWRETGRLGGNSRFSRRPSFRNGGRASCYAPAMIR